jgi:hypothetical protein
MDLKVAATLLATLAVVLFAMMRALLLLKLIG